MQKTREHLIERIERVLSLWPEELDRIIRDLAQGILTDLVLGRTQKRAKTRDLWTEWVIHWTEQMRLVHAELHLELALERSERRLLERFQHLLESLGAERANLLTELDETIAWVRRQLERGETEPLPSPKADLVPASSRLSELEALLKTDLESLPQACEVLTAFSARPGRRRVRRLYPRETVLQAFLRTGRQALAQVLEEVESEHRAILQQLERARQVVAFGVELAERNRDPQVAREALQNTLSLLEFSRREAPDWRPAATARMAQMLASVFVESRMLLDRHWLGMFTYLAQQRLHRAAVLALRSAASTLVRALRRLYEILERAFLRFLVRIGWRLEPSVGQVEVITRPLLPQEFIVDLSTKDLPALYRHLFRMEPVQDPRFLVGREREMAAIAEARALWEVGRSVTLIIVGERGSGKTSLINCAVKRVLGDLDVFRGEFRDRMVTEAQVREFLAELIGLADAARLEEFLAAERRVIVLEETERTFLRQVGYYAAIRELQRVIAATCSCTFWILSINQVAFRLLDAVVRLGSSFSHRINAATATRDALREAILIRHNLSGLRLHFAAPPSQNTLSQQLRSFFRGRSDPEALFFDSLAKESAGVFRTAFDIWLGQIESVQAGVLYLKPLVPSDLSPVVDTLDLDDLFTLVAILQHGSLTPEEHALVFQKSVAASRSQMDELLAREIIEPDPLHAGFRVRPEALRLVHEALYRRNLL